MIVGPNQKGKKFTCIACVFNTILYDKSENTLYVTGLNNVG